MSKPIIKYSRDHSYCGATFRGIVHIIKNQKRGSFIENKDTVIISFTTKIFNKFDEPIEKIVNSYEMSKEVYYKTKALLTNKKGVLQ